MVCLKYPVFTNKIHDETSVTAAGNPVENRTEYTTGTKSLPCLQ